MGKKQNARKKSKKQQVFKESPQAKKFKPNKSESDETDGAKVDEQPSSSKKANYDLCEDYRSSDSSSSASEKSIYDLCDYPRTTRSNSSSSGSEKSIYDLREYIGATHSRVPSRGSFSNVKEREVENCMGMRRGQIDEIKRPIGPLQADKLFGKGFKMAPDLVLNEAYACLRESLRTKQYPLKGVSESIRSFHFGQLLDKINLHFLNEYDIERKDLEIVSEWPVDWMGYQGQIDFAVFRTGQELDVDEWKMVDKKYFYVVEMKAGDPLDGLKQAMMYLSRLKQKDNNEAKVGSKFFELRLIGFFSSIPQRYIMR